MPGEWYKMDFDAWDEGTDDLTLEQEAAYLRLCHQLYRRKAAIPNSPASLARIWRCHQNKARKLISDLVEAGKVTLADGLLTNTRVTRELDDRETRRRQQVDAGHTGGTRSQDNRRKALKTNDQEEADASAENKQNQAEREGEREEEKKDKNPQDPSGSLSPKGDRRTRSSICPEDFQPTAEHFAKALQRGFNREFVLRTRDRMRDWSHANAGRAVAKKSDWTKAFHNFLDRAMSEEPPRPGARFAPVEKSSPATRLLDRMEARHVPDQHTERQSYRGAFIDHEGDGRPDRQVHEQAGGQAGRFSQEAHLRVVGSDWR